MANLLDGKEGSTKEHQAKTKAIGKVNPTLPSSNKTPWSPLNETRSFIKQVREKFLTTGAILPSSKYLARAICSTIRGERLPWNILEVGPGTGAITREIAKVLKLGDTLTAIEINESFAEHLRQEIETKREYAKTKNQIKVVVGKLEDLEGSSVFDCILSGLPMNNFEGEMVRQIFDVFHKLIKPDAPLSYYEYFAIRDLKYPFVPKSEKQRLKEVTEIVDSEIRKYQVKARKVWLNVPPAVVRTLVLKPTK